MELPSEPAARDVHGLRVRWPAGSLLQPFRTASFSSPNLKQASSTAEKSGLERQAIWRSGSELGRTLGLKLVGVDHVTPQEDRSLQQKPPSPVNFGFRAMRDPP